MCPELGTIFHGEDMPRVQYKCQCSYSKKKFYNLLADIQNTIKCDKCELDMTRILGSPASKNVIVIDNGLMTRSIEIDENVLENAEERSTKDNSKY